MATTNGNNSAATMEEEAKGLQPNADSANDENSGTRKRKRTAKSGKQKVNDDDALLDSVVQDTTLQDSVALLESPSSARKQNWMDFYNRLVVFQQQNGHTEVPQRYKNDPALGAWCKNQREYYKRFNEKKTSSLTEERIALLNKIGFAWVSTKTRRKVIQSFEAHMEELQAFKQEFGHCRVPHVYEKNPGLGVFCHRVKIYHREMQEGKRKSPNDWLTPDRIQALEEMGFEWKVGRWSNTLSWDQRLEQLAEHKNQFGHVNISKEYDQEHAPGLKAWVANQRTYLTRPPRGNKRVKSAVALTEEKIASLKSLGVEFHTKKTSEEEDMEVEEALNEYATTVAL